MRGPLRVRLKSSDTSMWFDILNTDEVSPGATYAIGDELTATYETAVLGKGGSVASFLQLVVHVAETHADNIADGLVAAWLYGKLKAKFRPGRDTLVVANQTVPLDHGSIADAVRSWREQSGQPQGDPPEPQGPPIDSTFVEQWNEAYRHGATNTRWRPGPKLRDAMRRFPDLQTLDTVHTFWELEEYIFGEIGASVRATGAFTVSQFLTVSYWKSPRPLALCLSNENTPGTIRRAMRQALAPERPQDERLAVLVSLAGVRAPVASALLTVWNPDQYTIIDRRALSTLGRHGEAVDGIPFCSHSQRWWENHYDLYLRACQAMANRAGPCPLRALDRALWKWGRVNMSAT